MSDRAPCPDPMPIYLDNHATTPVDPRVLDAMLPYFREKFGNASSRSHVFGWDAEKAVERAREQVAQLLGAESREIVFTSGATESNNLAIRGAVAARRDVRDHIITSPIEHPAVLDTVESLRAAGVRVTVLPVDSLGRVSVDAARAAADEKTALLSVMVANNEIGTTQPVRELGAIAEACGAWLHSDATQGVGRLPLNVITDTIHLASLTAHKIHGPQGAGALYVRRRNPAVRLVAQNFGGSQERGMRAGTLNVPGIVGLGMACELCRLEMDEETARVSSLRDRLRDRLQDGIPDLLENGDPDGRLPGNLNISIPGVENTALMMAVPEIAISSGAACASGQLSMSHVMAAMGVNPSRAGSSLRFGLGRFTTETEIATAADLVIAAARQLRR